MSGSLEVILEPFWRVSITDLTDRSEDRSEGTGPDPSKLHLEFRECLFNGIWTEARFAISANPPIHYKSHVATNGIIARILIQVKGGRGRGHVPKVRRGHDFLVLNDFDNLLFAQP